MKLSEGIKHTGNPFEIPNASRDDLPQFFVEMGYKVGAEIGVYKGAFSEKLCRVGLKHYAVDPWKMYSDYLHNKGQDRLDFLHEHTQRVLNPYPTCTIVRKTSMEALEEFKDNSLDYVYIDSNHKFRYIAEDLAEWYKKVKPRGIISGHDYTYIESDTGKEIQDVAHVLKAYMASYKIPSLYVIGSRDKVIGQRRDKWRSWMFIKP